MEGDIREHQKTLDLHEKEMMKNMQSLNSRIDSKFQVLNIDIKTNKKDTEMGFDVLNKDIEK